MLADDSHEISFLIYSKKLGKMSQNLSSAAVVIGALRVKETCILKRNKTISIGASLLACCGTT